VGSCKVHGHLPFRMDDGTFGSNPSGREMLLVRFQYREKGPEVPLEEMRAVRSAVRTLISSNAVSRECDRRLHFYVWPTTRPISGRQ
jgi:hypothetical protein